MLIIKILFWICLLAVLYTYIGYPLLLVLLKMLFKKETKISNINSFYPKVTLFVTAYNEADFVDSKVKNSFELDYPKDKLEFVWVTDGSDDKTNELLANYPEIKVYFKPERNGKINAMNRGMDFINSEIVIFSDGNTLLSPQTVSEMVKIFQNQKVGCIAGEKRILLSDKDDAATSGEGMYWKYESWVKNLDSELGSCIGAAGELFAIRKDLFFKVPEDTILDDFIISLTIASKGYKIAYAPNAYAMEKASANVAEEMKRKIRIAAGSIQSTVRLKKILNPFKYGFLSFQYISHKIFRWIIVPLALFIMFFANGLLIIQQGFEHGLYLLIFMGQIVFYSFVLIGALFQNTKISLPVLFVPYYFFMGNIAMWQGFFRYRKGKQSVNWERAKRAS
ncbi:MAG: glycosyltransferase family 2 protein [Salinivirgaceae bacterium]|nr:glycosyltransferase family 2 protein [Salinivirgaceae bacterium]